MSSHHSGKPHSAWVSTRFPIMTSQRLSDSVPSFDATPLADSEHSYKNRFAQTSGKYYYRLIKNINILPDDVLLEIFDFYHIGHVTSLRRGSDSGWLKLVHVCQRWRHIVLVSSRRLGLTLFCTLGTPVRKNLGCLPPFPIIVDYHSLADVRSPVPDYKDDIIAALEHPDRVRTIKLAVTSSLLGMVASAMQEPFPVLTNLWLSSKDPTAPVIPDVFLRGPAPHLLQIFLEGISFSALPTLLLSTSNLVDLQLKDIPRSGYISPQRMATSLAWLNRLDTLFICFKAPRSLLQLRSSPTRHVLLSLVTFHFRGSSEYLEHLLAQIDTPRLRVMDITYFNQLDFQVPQLSQFIRRTEHLELSQSQHLHGRIRISSLGAKLDFQEEGHRGSHLTLRISCKWLDWQVLHLAQILGQSPAMVSNVEHLSIDENDLQVEAGWKDSLDDTDWLELLRPFTAVTKLHGSKQLAGHIALALDDISGEVTVEILPALSLLSLEDQPVQSAEKFLTVRQLSGHPVAFIGPADLLVDGFIARTFASEDANSYLKLLLPRKPQTSKDLLQYYGITHLEGGWYITFTSNLVQGTSSGVPRQHAPLLDYSTRVIRGTVVPQRRWTPANEVDVRRRVENAVLQLPIFFVNRNGGFGFPLRDILRGRDRDLLDAKDFAPLGGRTIAHIRIGWPGYMPWERQIFVRTENMQRNPITVGHFMKQVGRSVDSFFQTGEYMSSDDVRLVDRRWRIGEAGGITREDVIVVGAINVSVGSWMPILRLNRDVA